MSQLRKVDRAVATNPGHLITDYGYDGAGRLVDIVSQFNITPISNYHYDYDDGDRLSSKNGTDGSSTVGYGNDNQLSSVDNATRPNESYSFDALGIRTGWVTDTVDKRRVLSDGTYQYQYDDEGNLTQKKEISTGKITAYVWDYRNRLSRVNLSDGSIVEYGYDAEDRRVSKKINGVTKEKYVYDGEDIALVVDAAGTLVERYLDGDGTDNVLSRVSAGTTVWSLGDRQGSVVDLVDGNGTVLNHFVYDSFGNRTAATGADFRFGYTGRELDSETGLYYYRARYYDPGLGRFISEDPIGFSAGDTNLYRYVNNSPTNFTDPTGEFANVAAGAGFGALFGGLYALANDIESGQFGWNTFGNVLQGAAKGAAIGAVVASGVGLLAAGATAAFGTSVAGAIVNTAFVAAGTAYGAYNAGGNFGQGKYLTGALDLFGVVAGAKNVFSGVTRNIPQMYWAEVLARRANFAAMYPPNPNPPGSQRPIYQVGDPQLNSSGTLVPTGSSALANRTSMGSAMVPYRGGANGGTIIVAADTAGAVVRGTNCFVAGTEIQTLDGTKNIEDIHVGDWVLSDDPNTPGDIEYKQVLQTFAHDTTQFVDVYIDGEKITTTEEHPFWVPDVGWVLAKDLHAGSHLQTKTESWLDIDKVELHGGLATVYNFKVEGFHTYFVSDLGLLVHNNNCEPSPTGHPVLAEVENITPGNSIIEASKPSMQGKLGEVHRYENPGHHDSNLGSLGRGDVKFNSGKSVLPDNHVELFKQSVPFKNAKGEIVRYTQDEFGNIHRFNSSIDNHFHWTGSTNGTDIRGRKVPLEVLDEAQKFFKNK